MKWMIVILLAGSLVFGARDIVAQATRTGTFDSQAVALAYYRSPQWNALLGQKRAELRAAQQADDQRKVVELNQWFGDEQEQAHRQVFDKAPIDSILPAIAPALDEICKGQNLARVVPASAAGSAAQTVDVTGQLLDWLKADDKTRDLIRQMQQK